MRTWPSFRSTTPSDASFTAAHTALSEGKPGVWLTPSARDESTCCTCHRLASVATEGAEPPVDEGGVRVGKQKVRKENEVNPALAGTYDVDS